MSRMKVLLLLTAVALAERSCADEDLEVFQTWKQHFGKTYDAGDETTRFQNWKNHRKLVADHNTSSFHLGMTKFADMGLDEWRSSSTCVNPDLTPDTTGSTFLRLPSWIAVPASIDWRTLGYVTSVKDQGTCNSCWAFTAVGSLEGQHFAKNGQLVSLSTQQLVDCSTIFGNTGCTRGNIKKAFMYIHMCRGIESDYTYSYEAADNVCRFNRQNIVATCLGYFNIPSGDELALRDAVGSVGPVSTAIDASHISFALYVSGVYDEPQCSSTAVTHGVVIVGYGTYQGKEYWLVKNSEGVNWGMSGYMMMSRNKNNQCGIATSAVFPRV